MKLKKILTLGFSVLLINIITIAQNSFAELNLMPVPYKVELANGKFRLDNTFCVGVNNNDARIFKAALRMINILSGRTGICLERQFPDTTKDFKTWQMVISVNRKGNLDADEDESYSLDVAENGISLKAETDIGAIRGLATLTQLIKADENGYYIPAVKIKDEPRFKWRGLLVDVCRHFIPVDVIKRNIDAMEAVKMNVLHWHLTEDQGFRVECKAFPKLQELGSDGLYYTQEEIKDVVAYAADRGIRVMPEFDLPGHATGWLVGYPELASAPGPYSIERNWGIFSPTFDPTNEETYKFLDTFFKEMSELFPDKFWHIGGDENNGKQWNANPEIQDFMKKNNLPDNHALQNYFNKKLGKILAKYNKTMVGWYSDKQPDLGKDYVVQSWKGRSSLYESAKNGYRCLLSHGFYIDLVQSTEYHYMNDPIPQDTILSDEVRDRILGGEATMWSEYVGPETIDSRIWPRTAAIAERLWSPGSVDNVEDMFRRLDIVSIQLEDYGLTHIKNYDMMLRRLANSYDIAVLKNFVDVIQPIFTYDRKKYRRPKSFHPLTKVADVAKPDPRVAREFNQMVSKLSVKDINNEEKISPVIKMLDLWKSNHTQLQKLIKESPVLNEIETLSKDLSVCADIGLQAVDYMKKKQQPEQNWIDAQMEILKKAETPRGETELAITKSIKKLVEMTKK